MKIEKALINFNEINRKYMPFYYDYAIAIDTLRKQLFEITNKQYTLYTSDVGLDDLDSAINQLLKEKSDDIEIIAAVYDHVSSKNIDYSDEAGYSIVPNENNNLLYSKKHDVAFVNMQIYQSHMDYPHQFIFAEKDENIISFITDIMASQRDFMLNGITLLTDTEDGLERTKENITAQIQREDVLLAADIKRDIFRAIDEFFIDGGTFFKTYNIPYKRGILLYGNPGNGKTTLVKSIAGSTNAPVVYWQITEYTSSYSISEVFQTAKRFAPVILIIEDIDSMPHEARSVFLNALDGATSKDGIFLIGTTNYPEKIDPALINRAGRFDRAYEIKQPDETLRYNYLVKKNVSQFIDEDTTLVLAKKTKGLSISQLNELYMSIALEWHYEKTVDIDKIINDLLENHRKTMKNDWEMTDSDDRFGF